MQPYASAIHQERMSTVLFVSNDPDVREVLECVMVGRGHVLECWTTINGLAGEAFGSAWSVLFVDLHTAPGLQRWLGRELPGPESPRVVVIGTKGDSASASNVSQALRVGAFDFLMKPLDSREIEAVALSLGL